MLLPSDPSTTLKYLYIATTGLCVMMIGWTLFVPGSWLFGRSQVHDEVAGWYLEYLRQRGLVPPEFFTKYQGHTLIHVTHLLPSALWCAAVPFQLHDRFRTSFRRIHRWIGYIFFSCVVLMALGLCIILQRDLLFETSFPDLPPPLVSFRPIVLMDTLYFVGTAFYSLQLAKKRQFWKHQRWVVRHIASGLFIAIQRILIAVLFGPLYPPPVSREVQRSIFGQAGILGMIISFGCAEYAILLLDMKNKKKEDQST
mmetsp:Transcript_23094/g.42849  ORF Transcript_23094/g.42849 Transcript_23094/m.42849 type:complete len:255 (-) Transcript_23094:1202-1966(-)